MKKLFSILLSFISFEAFSQSDMKTKFPLLLFLLFPLLVFAQLKQGEFTVSNFGANSVIQSSDGGYVSAGWYATGNGYFYVMKLDSDANFKWGRTIGGATISEAYSVIQTEDGGYAATGYCTAYGAGGEDVYVVRLDHLGNVVWTRTIGGPDDDRGYSIIQTKDDGFAITGGTHSFGNGVPNFPDIYVIKLDSAGNKVWTKTIEGPWGSDDVGYSIIQTNDGGVAITGSTLDLFGWPDVFIFKLDSTGSLKWANVIGGSNNEGAGYSIVQTIDKGFAIAGYTFSYGAGGSDVYIVKLDSLGNLNWTKTIGGTKADIGYSIVQTKDAGYAVAGETDSYGSDSTDIYIIKLNSIGNLKWSRVLGEPDYNEAYSLIQTKDAGYAVALNNSYGMCFVKLDSLGNCCIQIDSGGLIDSGGIVTSNGLITSSDSGTIGTGGVISSEGTESTICEVLAVPEINQNESEKCIYPNPSNGAFTLSLNHSEFVSGTQSIVKIYNIMGEKIYYGMLKQIQNDYVIDISTQPDGIYLYQIISKSGVLIEEGKLIIQK
jgi:hypothetical protein